MKCVREDRLCLYEKEFFMKNVKEEDAIYQAKEDVMAGTLFISITTSRLCSKCPVEDAATSPHHISSPQHELWCLQSKTTPVTHH